MFRKMVIPAFALSILMASPLFAIQYNWVGGEWGNWQTATNWNPVGIPQNSTDVVTIDGGATHATVEILLYFTIDSLDTYNTVKLKKGGTFDLTNGLTNHGVLQISDLEVYGDVTNYFGATLSFSEHANIHGDLINNVNATMEFQDIDTDVEGDGDGGRIINYGLIQCYPGGGVGEDALFENNAQIQLYMGGVNGEVFNNNTTGTIKGFGHVTGDQLQNNGSIEASMGHLLLHFSSVINTGLLENKPGSDIFIHASTAYVNNQGTIVINAGGSVSCDVNLLNQPGAVIKLLGGTLGAGKITQKADANFTGFGGITGNVQIEPNAIIKLTGPTNIVGDVNIPAGAILEISDGQTLITGQTACKGTIHLKGGTVIFQDGCDCADCDIINEAGIDRNHFDLNVDGKVDLRDFDYFAQSWLWEASWF